MTKVEIMPGICGLTAIATAESEDGMDVTIKVETKCADVKKMMEEVGEELDAMEILFKKPGAGPLYEAAAKYCPHAACPVTSGLLKCIEAECNMALPKDVSIKFL